MVKLAVARCDGEDAVLKAISSLFKMAGLNVFSYKTTKYGTFRQLAENSADVFIAPVSYYLLEQSKYDIDIMVFARNSRLPEGAALNLSSDDAIIIVNADDRHFHSFLQGSRANIITYGFNPRATVTASSIEGNMEKRFIQLCIQRSFKTASGVTVDAQEIPVTFTAPGDDVILDEIAAVTAALSCGVDFKTISLAY